MTFPHINSNQPPLFESRAGKLVGVFGSAAFFGITFYKALFPNTGSTQPKNTMWATNRSHDKTPEDTSAVTPEVSPPKVSR